MTDSCVTSVWISTTGKQQQQQITTNNLSVCRGDGIQHLVRTTEELSCYEVEVLMAEMQHILGVCGRHGSRALVHLCIECDAFLCDGLVAMVFMS